MRFDHVATFIVNANHSPTFKPPGRCLSRLVPAVVARTACALCDGFGIARNTATTFDVFFWLQVANFDVSLLHSAPNGPDHTHIVIFVLCLHGPNYFVATFALGYPTDPINANIFSALPLLEIALVLVRFDHVASFSVFKDKAGADESVHLAADYVQTHLSKLHIQKPGIIEGPIKAHD